METVSCIVPLRLRRAGSQLSTGSEDRREYAVTFISAGYVQQRDGNDSNWRVPPETLQAAAPLLDGVASFVDHASWFDQPSVRDLAGVTFSPVYNHQAERIEGGLRLYDRPDLEWLRVLLDQVLADQDAGKETPNLGLSLSFFARHDYLDVGEEPGLEYERVTTEITHVESCDIVFGPGAEGRFREILSAAGVETPGQRGVMPQEVVGMEPDEVTQEEEAIEETRTSPDPAETNGASVPDLTGLVEQVGQMSTEIARLTGLLAEREEASAVQGMGVAPRQRISVGPGSLEQVQLAAEALLNGVAPGEGVAPLSGIRELYQLLSGDYSMTGMFQADHVYLANVNSSTMSNIVANVLNKKVINEFQEFPRWWEKAVTIESFTSLQDARWITLGGVGELPTVSEGAAYTELTWDDAVETDSFVKKGGYLGITLEAIDKDDTARLRSVPRVLARSAWLTLSKSISAIFTSNSGYGVAMADTNYLFDSSNHSNQGTSALSYAAWKATSIAMQKFTEVHSGERLGALTAPYLLWVPIDLEPTAIQALGSAQEPGTADNDVNPYAEGEARMAQLGSARERIIKCPLWTDTNNWVAQADPRLYPGIGLGYRFGEQPEIFSVASPTAGLMFTNDTMPVKVRYFYAVGPTDYRAFYGHIVS